MLTAKLGEVELHEGWSEADAAIRARFAGAVDAQRGTASSAVVFVELEPGWRGGRHIHSAEEVAFIYSGSVEIVVGQERRRLSAGELAVVPALVPHDVINVGEDLVRMVNFFPSAAFLTVFDDRYEPLGSREVFVGAPPPSALVVGEVIGRFYDEVLNAGRTEALDELVAPEAELYFGPELRGTGPQGFGATLAATRAAFPDAAWTLDDLLPAPEGAAARFTFTGTHRGEFHGIAATDNSVSVRGIETYRLADGKVVDNHVQLDTGALLAQLNAQPATT